MPELPIVCTLQPGELAARVRDLLPGVARLANSRVPTENGYRFEFLASSDCLKAIVAMIDAERLCCRFMRFRLTIEPDGGPVRLDVTGPAGTREFLADLVDLAGQINAERADVARERDELAAQPEFERQELAEIYAHTGGAPTLKASVRVAFWGALAMGITAVVGRLFGTVV